MLSGFIRYIWLIITSFIAGDTLYVNWTGSCDDWSSFRYQKIKVVNNVWGKTPEQEQRYSQCVHQSKLNPQSVAWSWSWPVEKVGVKAYPSVIYGKKPWYDYSTTDELPIQLAALDELIVDLEFESQHTGSVNLLLEAWLTDDADPKPYDRTSEIAVHLYQQNWPGQGGEYVETVNIEGDDYAVYLNHKMQVYQDPHVWSYISFVNHGNPIKKKTLNFKKFLDYALEKRMIINSEYLASLELGNEIDKGSGHSVVRKFNVQVLSK